MRLLVVEDEKNLAISLKQGLENLGYAVDLAFDGIEGEEKALVNDYDVIILDLNLPHKNGIDICKAVRSEGIDCCILILTARDKISDRALGLDCGADDYMVKPFAFEELRARIQALLRRFYGKTNPKITIGDLVVDPSSRVVTLKGNTINLTTREFDILEFMAHTHPSVVSTEDILEHVWGEETDPFSNVVRVHLANLRRKLKTEEESIIITVKGKGYKLC